MDPNKQRAQMRPRKTFQTPRKPGEPSSLSSSPIPTSNMFNMSTIWDCNSLGSYFSMLNMKDNNFYAPPAIYGSTPSTPISDLMSINYLQPNAYVPLSRSRTSSFLPSDATSDSSRRGSEDYGQQPFRSFSSAAIERPRPRRAEYNGYTWDHDEGPRLSRSASSMSSKPPPKPNQTLLPSWCLDSNGYLRPRTPLAKVLDSGDLGKFALDKIGCQFLQEALKKKNITSYQKYQIFDQILGRREDFIRYSTNIFGNFLVQQVMDLAMQTHDEDYLRRQEKMRDFIASHMTDLCLDKSACRVVQFALDNMERNVACSMVQSLPRDARLIAICVDQNANHVIQKVVAVIPLKQWEFIVDFVAQPEHLRQICSDKYGCRVVQTIVEKLTIDSKSSDLTAVAQNLRERALQRLMHSITSRCQELATNEYANYIIQHIVSNDDLAVYREIIIEKCLMRNLLSLAQEKFASHVVEKAFLKAPLDLLADMMDEIFDGYVPHPDTGKDALDIMMFHQFGNYVVQCMLTICCDAVSGRRDTKEGSYDHISSFHHWLKKLHARITKERQRLSRFSSGKKMIETLAALRLSHPYLSLGNMPNFQFECFSTASESEDNDLDVDLELNHELHHEVKLENVGMHLAPRLQDSSDGAHDGDDESTFSP